jgi:hypothetical protein
LGRVRRERNGEGGRRKEEEGEEEKGEEEIGGRRERINFFRFRGATKIIVGIGSFFLRRVRREKEGEGRRRRREEEGGGREGVRE